MNADGASTRGNIATPNPPLAPTLLRYGLRSMSEREEPPTLYAMVGGEPIVRALVDRFYDAMNSLPAAGTVRAMHAQDLRVSREKLFQFLSGWLGGPQLYIERHGHPRLRRRHLPFAIDRAAVEQWMLCMDTALTEVIADTALRAALRRQFAHTADFMRNVDEGV